MRWAHWVADVTRDSGGPLCFVPIEFNAAGEVESIVVGMTLIADRCPGQLVGAIHEDGQAAVEAWLADPANEARLVAAGASPHPTTESEATSDA